MSDITKKNSSEVQEQLAKAKGRKSQAKTQPATPPAPAQVAASQSAQGIQRTDQNFQNFQTALQQKLGQMHAETVNTARQVAEVQNSLPLVFEQAYQERMSELEAQGNGPANFPSIDCTQRPAFNLAESLQLSQSAAANRPALTGADIAAGQYGLKAAD